MESFLKKHQQKPTDKGKPQREKKIKKFQHIEKLIKNVTARRQELEPRNQAREELWHAGFRLSDSQAQDSLQHPAGVAPGLVRDRFLFMNRLARH